MRKAAILAATIAAAPLAACSTTYGDRYAGDPWAGDYESYYRAGTYDPYPLTQNDRVYRGRDGRYYCRRRDGTVGLVVGAGVGGLLGNLIAGRGSNTLGTLIGAAGGAAIGYAIERQQVRCQ